MNFELDFPNENRLAEWRDFRNLTQAELAEKVGTTGSVISLLETGKRALSPKWLRKLAVALDTEPGYLLDHSPADIPADVVKVWDKIPEGRRKQALTVLQTFTSTGTG